MRIIRHRHKSNNNWQIQTFYDDAMNRTNRHGLVIIILHVNYDYFLVFVLSFNSSCACVQIKNIQQFIFLILYC